MGAVVSTITNGINQGLTETTGAINTAITETTGVVDTAVTNVTGVATTIYTGTTQIVSTITNCVTSGDTSTKQVIYYCCNNEVGDNGFSCKTGNNTLTNVTFYELVDLPCFQTNWFNYTQVSVQTGCSVTQFGQLTGCKTQTFLNPISVNAQNLEDSLKFRGETFEFVTYCGVKVTAGETSQTGFLYVSADPLIETKLKLFYIKKNNCDKEIKFIPYKFTNLDIWRINYDYNLKSFSRINYYFESKNGTSYFTGLNYDLLPLYSISNAITKDINIFTTMISYKLMNSEFTNDKSIYFRKLKLLAKKILSSNVRYRLLIRDKVIPNNFSKKTKTDFLNKIYKNMVATMNKNQIFKKLFSNFYLNNSNLNVYLRKYDSSLFFILNVIYTNARNKNIDVNSDEFIKLTHKLLWKYNSRFVINTKMINKIYSCKYGNILDKNYDQIFNKWILYIYKSSNPVNYICAKFAPRLMNYEELLNVPIEELLNKYFDLNLVKTKYLTYLKETKKNINCEKCNKCNQYQDISKFDLETKNKIKVLLSEIALRTQEKLLNQKISVNNAKTLLTKIIDDNNNDDNDNKCLLCNFFKKCDICKNNK